MASFLSEYIRRRLTQTPNPTVFDILCWAREGDISNATASQLVFQTISEELRESVDRKYGLGPDQNLKTEGKKGAECDGTLTLTNTRTPSQNLEYRDVGMVMGAWETAIEGSEPAVRIFGFKRSVVKTHAPDVILAPSFPLPQGTSGGICEQRVLRAVPASSGTSICPRAFLYLCPERSP